MSIKTTILVAATAVAYAMPAFAADITVDDPYARASSMMSSSGAAFMIIHNTGDTDDHLVGAASDIADKVELHTHKEDDMGVMRMIHVEEGFAIPAGGTIEMVRGGHHVMFLGLKGEMAQGDMIDLTLQFEKAGDVTVEVPVDLERKPMHGQMKHGQMKQSD
ncbi:copper chaperone PCu(A)C [Lutimaribacter sp. EGI FJ00015]|uniref:Copper chaperone PCu(A)C n=1 Tax=Lutimaribacter degradans TaxID=2945989 RepID=A0ACC5ZUR0_9RHOB|nr:copper chaperone PCu(A)C [Lutimaribacter sp. EGI FJ00013]MCM2561501.1 copper chaperone PCu(A)C [Lutimaribacter sp. EGI FJ00013]MCO0612788.1 copper chaperone PCu(A)C [Lutimaribacter sp. EGI FJ00015]MCO0635446.1 copper chaperone PCu(A)C [Lutimaribacter sp. EGI FJ00014]